MKTRAHTMLLMLPVCAALVAAAPVAHAQDTVKKGGTAVVEGTKKAGTEAADATKKAGTAVADGTKKTGTAVADGTKKTGTVVADTSAPRTVVTDVDRDGVPEVRPKRRWF